MKAMASARGIAGPPPGRVACTKNSASTCVDSARSGFRRRVSAARCFGSSLGSADTAYSRTFVSTKRATVVNLVAGESLGGAEPCDPSRDPFAGVGSLAERDVTITYGLQVLGDQSAHRGV